MRCRMRLHAACTWPFCDQPRWSTTMPASPASQACAPACLTQGGWRAVEVTVRIRFMRPRLTETNLVTWCRIYIYIYIEREREI